MDNATAQEILRGEAIQLVLGVLVTASGFAASLLFFPRARKQNLALLYFGITAAMYGVRVLAETATVRILAPNLDHAFRMTGSIITGLIVIPFTLFFIEAMALRRVRPLWWFVGAEVVESIFYIYAHISGQGYAVAEKANHVTVLLTFPLMLLLFLPRRKPDRDTWIVAGGFAFMMCFALYTNVTALRTNGYSPDREYIGFVVLLACVGFVAARQTLRNEAKLMAIDQELAIARHIQGGLLPDHNVTVPGIGIATKYVPASSVAGDFYDFLVKDNRELGVLIADVSGHGVPAALSASMVKIAIHSQAEHAHDPSAVLSGLNSILYGNMQGQFVTAAYVHFDGNMLTYAGAGHPALLIWRAEQQRVERLEENGLFLGAFPACQYATLRTVVQPGDRLLLYTDGIVEAPNPSGEEFGEDRLQSYLASNSRTSGAQFCDALIAQLERWCARGEGKEQHDDLTLVLVDCLMGMHAPGTLQAETS